MKRLAILTILWCGLMLWGFGSPLSPLWAGQGDIPMGRPSVQCKVVNPPDPLLMGGWTIEYDRITDEGSSDINHIKYWLVKHGDGYALFFDRITRSGKKQYTGWRDWIIDGKKIESDTGVHIFVKDETVYYQWKNQKPSPMTPIK